MRKWMLGLAEKLCRYSTRWWYGPLIGFFAGLDAFIFIVSVEAILVPSVWARPKKWFSTAMWLTVGSAVGATIFAALASRYGQPIVAHFFPHMFESKTWVDTLKIIDEHGPLGLAFISFSPFPQHVGVAIAGLAHMQSLTVLVAVFLGRGAKYVPLAWMTTHAPRLLKKLRIIPQDFDLNKFQSEGVQK